MQLILRSSREHKEKANDVDDPHTCGNLHRARNQRLPTGRVLILDLVRAARSPPCGLYLCREMLTKKEEPKLPFLFYARRTPTNGVVPLGRRPPKATSERQMLDITAAHRAYLSRQTHSRPSRRTRTAQRFAARQTSSRCQTCIAPRGRAHDMTADVGSFAEAAKNARLHALCSRPMRLIPAFPLSSGEAETGIKALLSHKVTGARGPVRIHARSSHIACTLPAELCAGTED
jgi:hypothetical protein